MNKEEFNQLPEPQQRNALLAIALGKAVEIYSGRVCEKHADRDYHPLEQPEQDGALMWQLVCELRESYLKYAMSEIHAAGKLWFDTRDEQSAIAAYIAADPKDLIEKWRNENG